MELTFLERNRQQKKQINKQNNKKCSYSDKCYGESQSEKCAIKSQMQQCSENPAQLNVNI